MPRHKSDSRDLGTVHVRQFPFFNPFQVNEQTTNKFFYIFCATPRVCWSWSLLCNIGHLLVFEMCLDSNPESYRTGEISHLPGKQTISLLTPCRYKITIETSNPKCRLYWCLIEFINWRYSQSCWYFQTALWTIAPLPSLVSSPPLACVNKYTVYTYIVWKGGGGGVGENGGEGAKNRSTANSI